MEKSIITFSANEQNLQKTGGIGCYASDTVSYIEAHFALGENWSGYDSVRAVWFNDYKTISTVLNPNGVCIVPHEVLTSRGKVVVNLVGSVLVSDELSDRLTTFPCEALKVSAKAKISGSETAAVTPSQFEQFVSIVISEVEKVTGMTAQAETLPAGSQATARYENGILYLGIPQGIQGERGETGADGNGIASVVYNADYSLTLVFDNGEQFRTPPIRGERGPVGADGRDGTDGRDGADGVTPSLSVGTVTTLPSTEDAYVTRTGTDENPVFNFGIPQGPKGDTGEVTMSQLSSLLPTDTASGSIASFPDGTDLFPAVSVKVDLEPIQDLHGYDKPWVGGAGKNKAIVDFTSPSVINGITLTKNDDGTVTANGTITTAFDFVIGHFPLKAGSYILNGCPANGGWGAYRLQVTDYPVVNDLGQDNGSGVSFTLSEDMEVAVRIQMYTSPSNLVFKPMIRLATETDATFVPYSNICPISGHTEVVTSVSGVNVWDEEWELGSYNGTTGEPTSSTNTIRTKNRISVKPSTTYYVKNGGTGVMFAYWYDDNDGFISYENATNTATTAPSNAHYMRFRTQSTYGTTYNHDISINYPSTDHDYHAYQGNTYTTNLGRTVYGGTLDVVSGELVVDRAMVDMGTLNWSQYTADSTSHSFVVSAKTDAKESAESLVPSVLCSQYSPTAFMSVASWTSKNGVITQVSEPQRWIVRDENYTDATAFKTAMDGVQLCYELATPQTYQLTPTEVDLLLGQNNVWTDCGSVEVTYKADVGLYIDKKLGTSGTTTLSMTRTLDTKSDDTDDTKTVQLAED